MQLLIFWQPQFLPKPQNYLPKPNSNCVTVMCRAIHTSPHDMVSQTRLIHLLPASLQLLVRWLTLQMTSQAVNFTQQRTQSYRFWQDFHRKCKVHLEGQAHCFWTRLQKELTDIATGTSWLGTLCATWCQEAPTFSTKCLSPDDLDKNNLHTQERTKQKLWTTDELTETNLTVKGQRSRPPQTMQLTLMWNSMLTPS